MADAERILTDLLETVFEDENLKDPEYKIKAITSGGANYTSTLHLITIKPPGKDDLELFAKVACVGEQLRTTMQADRLYGTERFVYNDLSKIYQRLQEESNIPENERLILPKYYACNDKYMEETIILENLVAKGYTSYDRFKSVDWDYASLAVAELAKLHALSYAFAEDDPENFEKVASERMFVFTGSEEDMAKMWDASQANVLEVVPEENKDRLRRFFEENRGVESFKKFYNPIRGRAVMVHGDYRCSNLLHKQKDGKLEKIIIVDYQTLHNGSQLSDLAYFIFSGTDGEFRRQYYDQLIDHYYTTFSDFLNKLGLNCNKIYPREYFNEDYKATLPFGLIIAIFLLPIVLVEAENAPQIGGQDAKMEDFAIKPNDMFKKRFNEILVDCVKWGVL